MSIRYLTAGESHGKALVGIIEGIPSGLDISAEYVDAQLRRRKLGFGRGGRQSIEGDAVDIVTGVRHGKSLGSPIALMIENQDYENWQDVMQVEYPQSGRDQRRIDIPRPGHADYVGALKYKHDDMRNVLERASARETAMRVAVGSVARRLLEDLGISVASRVVGIGSVSDDSSLDVDICDLNRVVDKSRVRALGNEELMIEEIEKARLDGDTVGGVFDVYAEQTPAGLGSYVHWDRRIEGDIGKSFLSLNGIKGVEIGLGFKTANLSGFDAHDEYGLVDGVVTPLTNRSGGIVGGMTTGQTVVVRACMKPIPTLMKPLNSVNIKTLKEEKAHVERSDVCAVPAAAVIGESLLALVLTDHILQKFGGDSMEEVRRYVKGQG